MNQTNNKIVPPKASEHGCIIRFRSIRGCECRGSHHLAPLHLSHSLQVCESAPVQQSRKIATITLHIRGETPGFDMTSRRAKPARMSGRVSLIHRYWRGLANDERTGK